MSGSSSGSSSSSYPYSSLPLSLFGGMAAAAAAGGHHHHAAAAAAAAAAASVSKQQQEAAAAAAAGLSLQGPPPQLPPPPPLPPQVQQAHHIQQQQQQQQQQQPQHPYMQHAGHHGQLMQQQQHLQQQQNSPLALHQPHQPPTPNQSQSSGPSGQDEDLSGRPQSLTSSSSGHHQGVAVPSPAPSPAAVAPAASTGPPPPPPSSSSLPAASSSYSGGGQHQQHSSSSPTSGYGDFALDNLPTQCKYCPLSFANHTLLIDHNNKKHAGEAKNGEPFTCMTCYQQFSTSQRLATHNYKKHRDRKKLYTPDNSASPNSIRCKVCNARFPKKAALWRHEREMHSDIIRHYCEICDRSYVTHNVLRNHMQTIHGQKAEPTPGKAAPPDTNSELSNEPAATPAGSVPGASAGSAAVDSDEGSFPCEICKRCFKSESGLKGHMAQIHDNRYRKGTTRRGGEDEDPGGVSGADQASNFDSYDHYGYADGDGDSMIPAEVELHEQDDAGDFVTGYDDNGDDPDWVFPNEERSYIAQYAMKNGGSTKSEPQYGGYDDDENFIDDEDSQSDDDVYDLRKHEQGYYDNDLGLVQHSRRRKKKSRHSTSRSYYSSSSAAASSSAMDTQTELYECEFCGKRFNKSSSLYYHKYSVHSANKRSRSRDHSQALYACRSCRSVFPSRSELREHERDAHSEKRPQCGICFKYYATNSVLKLHMRTIHAADIAKNGSNPSSRAGLSSHDMGVMQGLTPGGEPGGHSPAGELAYDTGEFHAYDPSSVKVEGAASATAGAGSAVDFSVESDDGRAQRCKFCAKEFDSRTLLISHNNKHHAGKGLVPFQCQFCGQQFKTSQELASHRFRKHKKKKDDGSIKGEMLYSDTSSAAAGTRDSIPEEPEDEEDIEDEEEDEEDEDDLMDHNNHHQQQQLQQQQHHQLQQQQHQEVSEREAKLHSSRLMEHAMMAAAALMQSKEQQQQQQLACQKCNGMQFATIDQLRHHNQSVHLNS